MLLAAAAVAALVAALFVRGVLSWTGLLDWLGSWWLVLLAGALAVAAATVAWRGRTAASPAPEAEPREGRWSRVSTLVTAFTALGALVFTALSLGATRDQLGIAEQGQLTDRYTKAVDQLSADHLQARLGGIFALERLATDSPRDQQTIVEVLAAFIRTTSPRTGPCPKTPPDVEAAFLVITRRNVAREAKNAFAANLGESCLTGVHAPYADLTHLLLIKADLSGSDLAGATGLLTNLSDAKLTGADLDEADLAGLIWYDRADFSGASLRKATLNDDLTGLKLTGADLSGVDLSHKRLKGVDLTGARHDTATKTDGADYDAATTGAWWPRS